MSRELPLQLYRNAGNTCAVDVLLVILQSLYESYPDHFAKSTTAALRWVLNRRTDSDVELPWDIPAGKLGYQRTWFYRLLRHNFYMSRWNAPHRSAYDPPPRFGDTLDIRDLVRYVSVANSDCTVAAFQHWQGFEPDKALVADGCGPRRHPFSADFGPMCTVRCSGLACTYEDADAVLACMPACWKAGGPERLTTVVNDCTTMAEPRLASGHSALWMPVKCPLCDRVLRRRPVSVASTPSVAVLQFHPDATEHPPRAGMSAISRSTIQEFDFNGYHFTLVGIIYYTARSHYVAELRIRGAWYFYDDLSYRGKAKLVGHAPAFRTPTQTTETLMKGATLAFYARGSAN